MTEEYFQQQPEQDSAEIVKFTLNYDKTLKKLYLKLAGKKLAKATQTNPEGFTINQTIEIDDPDRKAQLNQNGISFLETFIEGYINEHTALGNINPKWIDDYIFSFKIELHKELLLNAKDWQFEPSKATALTNSIGNLVRATLSRALSNSRERVIIGKTHTVSEINTKNENEQEKKFLGRRY